MLKKLSPIPYLKDQRKKHNVINNPESNVYSKSTLQHLHFGYGDTYDFKNFQFNYLETKTFFVLTLFNNF